MRKKHRICIVQPSFDTLLKFMWMHSAWSSDMNWFVVVVIVIHSLVLNWMNFFVLVLLLSSLYCLEYNRRREITAKKNGRKMILTKTWHKLTFIIYFNNFVETSNKIVEQDCEFFFLLSFDRVFLFFIRKFFCGQIRFCFLNFIQIYRADSLIFEIGSLDPKWMKEMKSKCSVLPLLSFISFFVAQIYKF